MSLVALFTITKIWNQPKGLSIDEWRRQHTHTHTHTWKYYSAFKKRERERSYLLWQQYSLEGLMLKLKLQYFGHLMWGANSLEKTLMLGKNEGGWRRGWQRMRWLAGSPPQWTWPSRRWWRTRKLGMLQPMGSQKVWHNWVTEQPPTSIWNNRREKEQKKY